MKSLLIIGTQGIPLTILSNQNFSSWLNEQPEFQQQWLNSINFSAQGLCLIPDIKGQLAQVIFVTDEPDSYWVCGDIVNKLPQGQYVLKADANTLRVAAFSWLLGAYKFCRYKTNQKQYPQLVIADIAIVNQSNQLARAVTMVRDLINTPAADMMPQHLAKVMEDLAVEFNASFSQIVGDELIEQNYPSIHMVGRASVNAPRLLELNWGDNNAPKVTLVGKGVCFDSGGLDLKPASGMRLMKKDMGGAAHVIALAQLIMATKLPIRLRVLVPAVENAVSANAFRPGDVVTTRHGLTVEIGNTDAEGRLVLCDAISEANNDDPELIIDFATLTGAMRIALGTEIAGFFCNDDTMTTALVDAGSRVEDPVWNMPLHRPYKDFIRSDIAHLSNCGNDGFGGAITAALYLEAFVDKQTSWVHFDVMGWNKRSLPGRPVGGEAFGIRAVYEYLSTRFSHQKNL